MQFHELPVFIYGLYDDSGVCHYIGQTSNPNSRRFCHLESTKAKYRDMGFAFSVIRKTTEQDANRIEHQIGTAYKRKGQATLSKVFGSLKKPRARMIGTPIYAEGFHSPFANMQTAAFVLGCSEGTIKSNLEGSVLCGDEFVIISASPIEFNYQI